MKYRMAGVTNTYVIDILCKTWTIEFNFIINSMALFDENLSIS